MSVAALKWRVIAVAATCGLLGMIVAMLVARSVSRITIARTGGRTLSWMMQHGEQTRCEASPAAWDLDGPSVARTWAYDGETHLSQNANAPPLDEDSLRELERSPDSNMVVHLRGFSGGTLAMRLAASGPCAIVVSHWSEIYPRSRVIGSTIMWGLLVGVASAMVSVLLILRPLVRRIANVRRSAARVGDKLGYAPAEVDVEDHLGQLARELDRAHTRIRADAEELDRRRDELQRHIADVAHDLRTPIASLQLALEQAIGARVDPAEAEQLLASAVHDVVYIGGLIGNLRLASEMRDGGASPAAEVTTSLTETVERATARVRFLASQAGVTLNIAVPEEPVPVTGDPIAVEQAIANVVENAVTHGSRGGHVAVLLEVVADGWFQITVVDDGRGVLPSELPLLGQRTFRSDSARQRDRYGRGLGLAITREVCTRAGWDLAFAAESPVGLRVTIRGSRRGRTA